MTAHPHSATRPRGHRLSDPRDPVVKDALRRQCPACKAEPEKWCVGVAENSRTQGRRLTRIHSARATMRPNPTDSKTGTGR